MGGLVHIQGCSDAHDGTSNSNVKAPMLELLRIISNTCFEHSSPGVAIQHL